MSKFQQSFCLQPVGQGLFYTGILNFDNNKTTEFRLVFDCGSENKSSILEEVEGFRRIQFTTDKKLDLLIISHFHADHINHIKSLLTGGIKVKKIVLPFLDFEERVVLVLHHLERGIINTDAARSDLDNFVLDLIIDPGKTLENYLGDDGEMILIDTDPDNPPFEPLGGDSPGREGDDNGFIFDIPGKLNIIPPKKLSSLQSAPTRGFSYALDSKRGYIWQSVTPAMEFLFYRKSLGEEDKTFFKNVYELFIKTFKSDFGEGNLPTVDKVTEIIKNIKDGTLITGLFKEAQKMTLGLTESVSTIENLNTTALCLLHFNLPSFYQRLKARAKNSHDPYFISKRYQIQKLDGTRQTHFLEKGDIEDRHNHQWYTFDNEKSRDPIFPNTLLTSDCVLLSAEDVTSLLKRYARYWSCFWLFQVPHHGAKKNSNYRLFTLLDLQVTSFINYGIKKEWVWHGRHPHQEVIADLIATGHSAKLQPVNEHNGLLLNFTCIVNEP